MRSQLGVLTCLRPVHYPKNFYCPAPLIAASIRGFSTSRSTSTEAGSTQIERPALDPNTVATPREERRLLRSGVRPIGSRRRRAVLQSARNIPFEQLPYQCFQEARKILQEDRQQKIQQIETQRARIERLKAQNGSGITMSLQQQNRLTSMRRNLEKLKILADINDPMVKKRFEDGDGDMNRPIYRHLANLKWRSRRRLIIDQRLNQMSLVPDVLPAVDLTADVFISFPLSRGPTRADGRYTVSPGDFVDSRISANPPRLSVQVFDKGERLVTIAVIDSDIPNTEIDGFDSRCHFLAANITISPTSGAIPLGKLEDEKVVMPWLPPTAVKGSPYHRLSVWVLQQEEGRPLNVAKMVDGFQKGKLPRLGFSLRRFVRVHELTPVGAHLFRTEFDEGMDETMVKTGEKGSEVEFKRKRVEPLPYKKKDGERYR